MRAACAFAIAVIASAMPAESHAASRQQPPANSNEKPAEATAYVHPSGMVFPATVGAFVRTETHEYDPQGLDASANYVLSTPSDSIVATVYVYPAPPLPGAGAAAGDARKDALCAQDLERWKQEVFTVRDGARVVEEKRVATPFGDKTHFGRLTVFEFRADFLGRMQDIRSLLYVYCFIGGKWDFEYRVSHPKRLDAAARVDAFMKALPWTIPE